MPADSTPPTAPSPTAKRRSSVIALVLIFCASLLVSGLLGFATGYLESTKDPAPLWAIVGLLVGVAVSIGILGVLIQQTLTYWRTIDELARRAHTDSWFWGGSIGMGVGAMALVLVPSLGKFTPLYDFVARQNPLDTLVFGGVSVGLAALVGYSIWWVGYWLAQR